MKNEFDRIGLSYAYDAIFEQYYFMDFSYVTTKRTVTNYFYDIDQVVQQVKRIESMADTYRYAKFGPNDILSYLRTINENYDNLGWNMIAGDSSVDFRNHINLNDYDPISIRQYFSSFLERTSEYNESKHGSIMPPMYINMSLEDPKHPSEPLNRIDLIHMFAVMDANYDETGDNLPFNDYRFSEDIGGWAGDLQSYVREDLYKKNYQIPESITLNILMQPTNIRYEFRDLVVESNNDYFDYNDLLADIDGVNIVKMFLNSGNTLSQSIVSYYRFIQNDNYPIDRNRYKYFIDSVANTSASGSSSTINRFAYEVLYAMGLNYNNDFFNHPNFPIHIHFNQLSCDYPINLDVVSFDHRLFGYNLFIQYIVYMSTPPYSSGSPAPNDPYPRPGYYLESNFVLNGES